ncbi:MAG: hypothetical protein ACREIP_02840 [Alphaproteobacteria bacterium]
MAAAGAVPSAKNARLAPAVSGTIDPVSIHVQISHGAIVTAARIKSVPMAPLSPARQRSQIWRAIRGNASSASSGRMTGISPSKIGNRRFGGPAASAAAQITAAIAKPVSRPLRI